MQGEVAGLECVWHGVQMGVSAIEKYGKVSGEIDCFQLCFRRKKEVQFDVVGAEAKEIFGDGDRLEAWIYSGGRVRRQDEWNLVDPHRDAFRIFNEKLNRGVDSGVDVKGEPELQAGTLCLARVFRGQKRMSGCPWLDHDSGALRESEEGSDCLVDLKDFGGRRPIRISETIFREIEYAEVGFVEVESEWAVQGVCGRFWDWSAHGQSAGFGLDDKDAFPERGDFCFPVQLSGFLAGGLMKAFPGVAVPFFHKAGAAE